MKSIQMPVLAVFAISITSGAWSQNRPLDRQNVPIYSITVTERTVKAVNYQYRRGPTKVDFRGTVLLPQAKGDAVVESKAGRTEIEARVEKVHPPTRYGAEYLTYVLWAITPEGHPKNLGEVLIDGSGEAKMHVTTDLQTFGMIVTAEPYSAVRMPSDVVIMENEIRPDTVGGVQEIRARYDLLPRGHYTYEKPASLNVTSTATVPFERYEEILHVYQAQNAVQIAKAMGADRYAPETFGKAEQLLRDAQNYQIRRADRSTIVTTARQAAQTAEDARAITWKRKQDEELASAREQAAQENRLRLMAEAEAQQAKAQSSADRMQLEQERTAKQHAETNAAAARAVPPPPPPPPVVIQAPPPPGPTDAEKTELRVRLLQDLNTALPTLDTPRGLVVKISDNGFRGGSVNPDLNSRLARIVSIVAMRPRLYVHVEGHTDNSGTTSQQDHLSYQRAAAIRDALVQAGVPAGQISARGLGDSRPLVSNTTASGREQNRRVEITISGDAIGIVPYWDKPYPLVPR